MGKVRIGILAAFVIAAGVTPGAVATADTDDTAPFIFSFVSDGTLGENGWYVDDVSVSWSVSDPESEITSTEGCDLLVITSDQPPTAYTCTATSEGGTASLTVTVARDATAPTVDLVGGPEDGATYELGDVPGAPSCEASDATSGLDGACVVSGYDDGIGVHTVTATATDMAGHETTAARTYEVVEQVSHLVVHGFDRPVDMFETNVLRARRTVPLRFQVFDDGQRVTSTDVVDRVVDHTVDCESGAIVTTGEAPATGSTALRYDTEGQTFVFNWQAPATAGACHRVGVEFVDGQELVAAFRVR